ncbi:MAG: hypothetical protein JWO31_3836 [Phycisphaerales bacterium]|nr:hypothetical protein [Phycisphaerales bacterium]
MPRTDRRRTPPAENYSPRGTAGGRPPAAAADPIFLPPLKPSRRLFAVAAALVLLWLGVLLTLYVTTVFPHRHDRPARGDATMPPATLPAGSVAR